MTDVTGEITYYAKQEGTVWTFTPAPDPRDAYIAEAVARLNACDVLLDSERKLHERSRLRVLELEAQVEAANGAGVLVIDAARQRDAGYSARIAELEAALRAIRDHVAQRYPWTVQDVLVTRIVNTVLPQLPEGDMAITQEEVGA